MLIGLKYFDKIFEVGRFGVDTAVKDFQEVGITPVMAVLFTKVVIISVSLYPPNLQIAAKGPFELVVMAASKDQINLQLPSKKSSTHVTSSNVEDGRVYENR